jgi:hypothetical protein
MAVGRISEGWLHVRRAVEIDPRNEYAVENCRLYFAKMQEASGLKEGDSLDKLREQFGEPDERREDGGSSLWRYCSVMVECRDEKIVAVNAAMYRRRFRW